jgi:hypothetical protein
MIIRMTTVEITFRYATPPTEAGILALAKIRQVYGVNRLEIDRAVCMLWVEYDATRLNAAVIAKLVQQAGLEIEPVVAETLPPQPVQ